MEAIRCLGGWCAMTYPARCPPTPRGDRTGAPLLSSPAGWSPRGSLLLTGVAGGDEPRLGCESNTVGGQVGLQRGLHRRHDPGARCGVGVSEQGLADPARLEEFDGVGNVTA